MDGQSYHQGVFRAQPNEGLQRKIQKRNRPPVSCLLCRTRKVKCDRQQPCERCVKSGEAAFCEYAPRAARKPRSESRTQPDVRPRQEALSRPVLQVRLQKLEEMVNGLLCNAATNREIGLETPSSTDQQRNDGETISDLSTPPSTLGTAVGSLTNQTDSSYVGPTHWASILESIHDIRGIIETDVDDDVPSPSPPPRAPQSHAPDWVFGPHNRITMDQVVTRLPTRNKTDQLVLLYFRSRFTAAPYIHASKFQREYDGFWRDPSSVSLLWVSILASILWVASSTSIVKGDDLSRDSEAAHPDNLALLSTECLVAGDYLGAQPYSIEALLLHIFTELYRKKECTTTVWAECGLLIRLAQRMGYHRDPKYLSNISPFEGELRRRAWFFIEVFDCLFSFYLGMPPSIRDDECDTESPGNLFDLDFDENTMVLPPPRPSTEATSTLYLCYKSKLCRLLRRVIRFTLSIQPATYDDVLRIDEELRAYHEQLPSPLKIRPVRSYSFTDQSFDIVHRVMLEMMYLKSMCVLHRKYLKSEKDNPRYNHSRTACIDAAIRLLEIHAEYDEESRPGGRLYEDKYMLSGLSLHDFLIAAMVLCLDLTENIPSSQADRSRKLKALGTSYKIWAESKAVSSDAAHATRIVGAILRRVSMQDSAPTTAVPPSLPQPDIRGGSLASLLNNDTQLPPITNMPSLDQSQQLINAMDFSLDFVDALPLDKIINDPTHYDWNIIDQYLLDMQ